MRLASSAPRDRSRARIRRRQARPTSSDAARRPWLRAHRAGGRTSLGAQLLSGLPHAGAGAANSAAADHALMCGIAGILANGHDPLALRDEVGAMAACLEHRGPDDG